MRPQILGHQLREAARTLHREVGVVPEDDPVAGELAGDVDALDAALATDIH
jgi:hypothetical protein